MVGKSIELGRTFFDMILGDDPTERAFYESLFPSATRQIHWSEVLESERVVVLGEAGAGKTTEFHRQVASLTGRGEFAFLVSVDDLARDGIEPSLMPVDRQRLAEWRKSDRHAYFFLDSVDEGRLRGHRFETAVRRLDTFLEDDYFRARVVVSCRVSDWRADADLAVLKAIRRNDRQGEASKSGPTADAVKVIALTALNEQQVRELARLAGVRDPTTFVAAVNAAGAQQFIARPQDVQWIAGFWNARQAFGSLEELIRHNIDEKLDEKNPHRSSALSAVQARSGASALAGLASILKLAHILLPDHTLDADRLSGCLDPRHVLSNWKQPEIEDLLTRPLFDKSTYGRVRIHHRSVQEFLTADWMFQLVSHGYPRKSIEALIFRRVGNDPYVVSPEFYAAAAWLALWDDEIRASLVSHAPEVLMTGGDPSRLSIAVREGVLKNFRSNRFGRRRTFESYEREGLRRFADPQLATTINALLRDHGWAEDAYVALLQIVAEGKLAECVACAADLSVNGNYSEYLRVQAVRATAAAGTDDDKNRLLDRLLANGRVDHDIGGVLVSALFPKIMGTEKLVELIRVLEPPPANTITTLTIFFPEFLPSRIPAAAMRNFLAQTLDVVAPANAAGIRQLAPNRAWLLALLASVSATFVQESLWSPGVFEIDEVLDLLAAHRGRDNTVQVAIERMKLAVSLRPELRRHRYWQGVKQRRATSGAVGTHVHRLPGVGELWHLNESDATWLYNDANTRPEPVDREVAIRAYLAIRSNPEVAESRQQMVDEIRRSNPQFTQLIDELETARRSRESEAAAHVEEFREVEEAAASEEQKQVDEERLLYNARLDDIRSGIWIDGLLQLRSHALSCESDEQDLIDTLKDHLGDNVAGAAAEGWQRFWRNNKPAAGSTWDQAEVDLAVDTIGMEIRGGLELDMLADNNVDTALRYALRTLGRFPAWLELLVAAKPQLVSPILDAVITADYGLQPGDHSELNVLHRLPSASKSLRTLCAPHLLTLLLSGDPPQTAMLTCTIEVLLSTSVVDRSQIANIASNRVVAAANADEKKLGLWWGAYFQGDFENALSAFERTLAAEKSDADQIVRATLARFWEWSEDYTTVDLQLPRNARGLGRLIGIAFQHAPPADDGRHLRAFAGGSRDQARFMRQKLIALLTGIAGQATIDELRALGDSPGLEQYRDWFHKLAKERMSQDAREQTPAEIDELVRHYRQFGTAVMDQFHRPLLEDTTVATLKAASDAQLDAELRTQAETPVHRIWPWVRRQVREEGIWAAIVAFFGWAVLKIWKVMFP